MTPDFKITAADIGRVALSDKADVDAWGHVHGEYPLLWTIRASDEDGYTEANRFMATAIGQNGKTYTATFNDDGVSVRSDIDALIILESWSD